MVGMPTTSGRKLAMAIALVLPGCYEGLGRGGGQSGDAGPDEPTAGGSDSGDEPSAACGPSWVGLQRLNAREYGNTLRDLLGVDPTIAADLPLDPRKGGFDNNASALGITPEIYQRYLELAESAVAEAMAATPARFIACVPATDAGADPCVRATLVAFAERAFRRELDDTEQADLIALYDAARPDADDTAGAVAVVFQAILVSPAFLFRNDLPAGDPSETRALDDFALASRLSYFVWSSMPDDELFELARAGGLAESTTLRAQVRRMLLDPKADHFVEHFTRAWLGIDGLATKVFDDQRFAGIDAALLASMQAETVALVRHVLRSDLPPAELLTAGYTFVDDRLARHYGLEAIGPTTATRTALPAERRGLATHGSVLASTAHPDRTSIPARGMWVMDNLLCLPPPPPPPPDVNVGGIDQPTETPTTQRERFEQHRADPKCAACHATMDELGFGLEHFDAVGRWRDLEDGLTIDASGTLPDGRSFDGATELVGLVADDTVFTRCVAQNLLVYGLGRSLTADDACVIEDIAAGDGSLADVIVELVVSDAFRLEAPAEDSP